MHMKRSVSVATAALAATTVLVGQAFAGGTNTHSYTSQTQGYWGGKWWDNNSTNHTIYLRNPYGCTTSLSGEKSVTYRIHKLNGIFPATSLGDREFSCSYTGNRSFTGPSGNHEYQWQLVGINGHGSGGSASARNVTATY